MKAIIPEATIDFLEPITAPDRIELDGVLSFAIHNAGSATVTLGGFYTVAPGSTFNGGLPNFFAVVSDQIRVDFSPAGTRRVEVAVFRAKGEWYSNFEHQPV